MRPFSARSAAHPVAPRRRARRLAFVVVGTAALTLAGCGAGTDSDATTPPSTDDAIDDAIDPAGDELAGVRFDVRRDPG